MISQLAAAARRLARDDRFWLVAVMLLALVPRLYQLSSTPAGMSGDEIFNALDAAKIGGNGWPVFLPGNNGREPLFHYLMALSMAFLGESVFSARLPAALLGSASVGVVFLIGRQQFDRRTGLLAATFMAVSLWPLMHAHWALRAVSLTFVGALAVLLYGRAWRRSRWRDWLVAGVVLGLVAYTYIPGRIFVAILLVWLAALALFRWDETKRRWGRFLVSLLVAVLVSGPFIWLALTNADVVNQRVNAFEPALNQALAGAPDELLQTSVAVLRMFSIAGDAKWRYHLAGAPIFGPVGSLLFYLGLVVAAVSLWRRDKEAPAAALVLGWLAVMLVPVLILESNVSFLRAAGAQAPIYLTAGLGAAAVWRWLESRWSSVSHWLAPPLVLLGLGLTLAGSWRAYFDEWRLNPEVRKTYHADLGEMARYLEAADVPAGARVFVAYEYVLDNTTPSLWRWITDKPVTWFDFSQTLAWASGEAGSAETGSESWYLLPSRSELPELALQKLKAAGERETVSHSNGERAFDIYRIETGALAWDPEQGGEVAFVDGPTFTGLDVPQPLVPGESVPVTLHWQIPPGQARLPNALTSMRVQLEDGSGNVWAQSDGLLGYPQAGWQSGDRFVQVLELAIPLGLVAPETYLRVVLYDVEGREYAAAAAGDDRSGPFVVSRGVASDFEIQPDTPIFGESLALAKATLATSLTPGIDVNLALEWVALATPAEDYRARLELWEPEAASPFLAQTFLLWPDLYPPSQWRPGERVTTLHKLDVPLDIPTAANPSLRLSLLPEQGNEKLALTQGNETVAEMSLALRPHTYDVPAIERALEGVVFGPDIELLGYDLDLGAARPGGEVGLTLIWRALRTPDGSYTVFNHLVDGEGAIRGQFDSTPVSEAWLMETWLPGEIVVDERKIPISAEAAPGSYNLLIGLYDAESGRRLPVRVDGGEPEPDDQLLLQAIALTQ